MKLSHSVYNLFCHRVVHATNGPVQLVMDSSFFESLLTQTNDLSWTWTSVEHFVCRFTSWNSWATHAQIKSWRQREIKFGHGFSQSLVKLSTLHVWHRKRKSIFNYCCFRTGKRENKKVSLDRIWSKMKTYSFRWRSILNYWL